jgi:hypothetical protein
MTEFETLALDLLMRITRAVEALDQKSVTNADGVRGAGSVRNSGPRKRVRWGEGQDRIFAAVVEGMTEIGLTESRLKTSELITEAAARPGLRQALVEAAPPLKGPADAIDVKRLGKWLSDKVGHVALGWQLMADRSNKKKPRWYLVRSEGSGAF